ncbi:MAG: helix-turn-helix transcriptional regulator [Fimbriimonadaceae bacterium]|nr:helix-turn-helix transcriptional regulator [Fimbriimonadaceae bacterium]
MRARRWSVRADVYGLVRSSQEKLSRGGRVSDVAKDACLCPRQFERRFLEVAGVSPAQYRRQARLVLARTALAHGATVAEAQIAAGYASASTFAREFRSVFGHAPSEFVCSLRDVAGVPSAKSRV